MKLKDLLENMNVGETTVFDIADMPLGEDLESGGKKLTVEIRKNLPEAPRPPVRTESPRKEHTFFEINGFSAYIKKYGNADSVIFANPGAERISAVLNEKADKGFEIVRFTPMIHPLFAPWGKIAGTTIPLDDFIDFISANRRAIVEPNGRELVMIMSQIKATTTRVLQKGRGKNAVNGLVVTTQIQGQDQKDFIELPEMLRLFVPLYVGTSLQNIELDLTLGTDADGESLVMSVSCGDLITAKANAFNDAMLTLGTTLPEVTLTMGEPAHTAWNYLKEQQ